jgi:hypothetical protein
MNLANTIHVYDHDSDHETNFDLEMIPVGRCPAQPVEWLWPGRIPIGFENLLTSFERTDGLY